MWEDMGVRDKRALLRADKVYRKWARKQLAAGTLKAWVVEDPSGRVVASGCLWLQPVQPTPIFEGTAQPYLMSMYTEPGYRGSFSDCACYCRMEQKEQVPVGGSAR